GRGAGPIGHRGWNTRLAASFCESGATNQIEEFSVRIAIGQLWQESNTFNPLPTTRQDFEDFGVLRGAEMVERMADTNELGGFIQSLRRWLEQPEIVGLVRLPAWPSGRATHETFTWVREEMLAALQGALPVD